MKRFSMALLAAGVAGALLGCSDVPSTTPTAPSDAAVAESRGTGTFTSISMPGATGGTLALDINILGVIVGRYRADDGTHGFTRSKAGGLSTIDFPGASFTVAAGINLKGDIVGMYSTPDDPGTRHGYMRNNGQFTTVDPPGSVFTNALGINAWGDIVGRYCTDECDNFQGFLYHQGTFTTLSFPGAVATNAWKVNALGEVVGSYTTSDGTEQVFVWARGRYKAVPLPNGKPVASDNGGINLGGDIVGVSCDDPEDCGIAPGSPTHGFLLSHGRLTNIDYPGATASTAIGINLQRDIVGSYFDADGVIHGYVLTSGGHASVRDETGGDQDSGNR